MSFSLFISQPKQGICFLLEIILKCLFATWIKFFKNKTNSFFQLRKTCKKMSRISNYFVGQFNIQFNLHERLPRASWKFLFWLHPTLSLLLGQGFMVGQHLPCCVVVTGKEDTAVGDSRAVRHLPSHSLCHQTHTGHHQLVSK